MSADSRPMQTPVSVHALAQLPKPRYRGAVALLRAVRGSRRRGRCWWQPRRPGSPRSVPRSTPRPWSGCSAPARSTTGATGHRPRPAGCCSSTTPRSSCSSRARTRRSRCWRWTAPEQVITLSAVWLVAAAGIVFEWMPIPAPRGYVTSVYMFLGWIGAFAFVPLYETTGWWGVGLVAGGGLCVHHRRHRARGEATRSLARDLRLPRDLPRLRDPGRTAALLRDRLPRAPARLMVDTATRSTASDTSVRPRAPQPGLLGRRRRRLPGRARATRSRPTPRAWGVWRIPDVEVGALGDARGLDVLELGCGAAQWSIALAADGARVVGARPVARAAPPRARARSPRAARPCPSCARAARRSRCADGSFDLVFCDHGAMSFCEPERSVAEVARAAPARRAPRVRAHHAVAVPRLEPGTGAGRPGGCAAPTSGCDGSTTATARARSTSSCPTASGSAASGGTALVVDDLIELRAPKHASTSYPDFDPRWARRWPAEQVWVVRKA